MKEEVWDINNLELVLRFVKRDFSRYTLFIPLFKFSKSFLRLENKFALHLKLKYRSQHYEVAKIANAVASLVCCGVDRFVRMDDEFRVEHGLAKALGFPHRFFSSKTVYRFFRSFNGWNINQLEKINLKLLQEQKTLWYYSIGSLFIDLDMNTKSVEGKHIEKATLGYNRKRPGRLSLQWTVAHIAKVALYSALHTGTTSGKVILQKQVCHIETLLLKMDIDVKADRIVWRIDGGYFSGNNLCYLNKRRFIMRAPVNLKVVQPYWKDNRLVWQRYSKSSTYTDVGLVVFPDIETAFRIVLIRTCRKQKVLSYVLCTNLFEWTAKNIVKAYRGRQIVENCFRDTNQAFYSDKLPSGTFHGNQAFLWFIVLAYNQFFFFQKTRERQGVAKTDTQKTFPKISQTSRRGKTRKNRIITGHFRR